MFVCAFRVKKWLRGAAAAALLGVCAVVILLSINKSPAEETLGSTDPITANSTEANAATAKPSSEKVVYLTFDDGPSKATESILDVLKAEKVPATFFVIGATTDRGKSLYKRILDEGHSLGLHSYSHRYQDIYASPEAYLADMEKLKKHLKETAGVEPKIFRFPGGSSNSTAAASTMEKLRAETAKKGLVFFDWNSLAKDDKSTATPAAEMLQNVIQTAGEKNRIMILMHDDSLRKTAPEAVKMIIEHYRSLGYQFEAITEKTEPIQFSAKK